MRFLILFLAIALVCARIWGYRNRRMLDLIIQYMLERGYRMPREEDLEQIEQKIRRRK